MAQSTFLCLLFSFCLILCATGLPDEPAHALYQSRFASAYNLLSQAFVPENLHYRRAESPPQKEQPVKTTFKKTPSSDHLTTSVHSPTTKKDQKLKGDDHPELKPSKGHASTSTHTSKKVQGKSIELSGTPQEQWKQANGEEALVQLHYMFSGSFQACAECYQQPLDKCQGASGGSVSPDGKSKDKKQRDRPSGTPKERNDPKKGPQAKDMTTKEKAPSPKDSHATKELPTSRHSRRAEMPSLEQIKSKSDASGSQSNGGPQPDGSGAQHNKMGLERRSSEPKKPSSKPTKLSKKAPGSKSPKPDGKGPEPKPSPSDGRKSSEKLFGTPVLPNGVPCGANLSSISHFQFDEAAARLFMNTSSPMNCGDIGSAPCSIDKSQDDFNSLGGYAIVQSLVTLSTVLHNIYVAIGDAQNTVMTNMQQFKQDFYPHADDNSVLLDVLSVLSLFVGAFGAIPGAEPIVPLLGAIGTGALGVASSVISNGDKPPDPDPAAAVGNITSMAQKVYAGWATEMFKKGQVLHTEHPDDQGYTYTDIYNIIGDGTGINPGPISNSTPWVENLKPYYVKVIYLQTMLAAWNSSGTMTPFIAFTDGGCNSDNSVPWQNSAYTVQGKDNYNLATTVDNKCFYLYGAMQDTNLNHKRQEVQPTPETDYCSIIGLPGGNPQTLDGTKYGGLVIDDIIKSAVGGWKSNKQQNGGTPLIKPGLTHIPTSLSDAGFVNTIPVCAWQDSNFSGVNCPNVQDEKCGIPQKSNSKAAKKTQQPVPHDQKKGKQGPEKGKQSQPKGKDSHGKGQTPKPTSKPVRSGQHEKQAPVKAEPAHPKRGLALFDEDSGMAHLFARAEFEAADEEGGVWWLDDLDDDDE